MTTVCQFQPTPSATEATPADERIPLGQAVRILRDAGREFSQFYRANEAACSHLDDTVDRDALARYLGLLV